MSEIIKLTDEFLINPDDISSLEKEETYNYTPSGGCYIRDFCGTRIILKNGHKVYIKNMTPDEVLKKIIKSKQLTKNGINVIK
jgi:uncharacterized protein YlzI (FlbEa/FlbD family)